MSNRVFINKDGFIEQIYESHQTRDTLNGSIEESRRLIAELKNQHRPVLILVDVSNLGSLATPSRKEAVEALREISYDRIAIYGANAFAKALINLIVHASGKRHVISIFETRSEAEQWLREK